jgi:hypothetical protein
MQRSKFVSRTIAVAAIAAILAGGCTRSDSESGSGSGSEGETTKTTAAPSGDDRLAKGDFGDLTGVCGAGDGAASGTGVSDGTMKIGVVTDKGADLRPGLNQEMYDAGTAFAKWCNGLGGINGLKVEIVDLDAKLFDFPARMTEACSSTFALVGGGAALDDAGQKPRVDCGLVNFAGYVVSEEARKADLQVFAVPGPPDKVMAGPFRVLHELDPDAFKKVGSFSTDLVSVKIAVDQDMEAMESMGATKVYEGTFSAAGENNWRPFVQAMKSKDVQVLTFAGEPSGMVELDKAFTAEGWHPKYIVMNANMYDDRYVNEAKSNIGNVIIRTSFYPLLKADDNPATADYVELIDKYTSGGKKAMLGEQALSSWLLFAKSVKECGKDVTRECILEKGNAVTDWTGGGLHGQTDPATNGPTDCFLAMTVKDEKFVIDKEHTDPNEGIFNCDPKNVFTTTVQDK